MLGDIESLNRAAREGRHEVTAISFHAYPYVADRYALMPCGGSIGDGYGPLVVAREAIDPVSVGDAAGGRARDADHRVPGAEALRAGRADAGGAFRPGDGRGAPPVARTWAW